MLALDRAHVGHLSIGQKLISSLHLRALQHLQVIHRLLDLLSVDSAATIVIAGVLRLESWRG